MIRSKKVTLRRWYSGVSIGLRNIPYDNHEKWCRRMPSSLLVNLNACLYRNETIFLIWKNISITLPLFKIFQICSSTLHSKWNFYFSILSKKCLVHGQNIYKLYNIIHLSRQSLVTLCHGDSIETDNTSALNLVWHYNHSGTFRIVCIDITPSLMVPMPPGELTA